jgi:hypothetical protein
MIRTQALFERLSKGAAHAVGRQLASGELLGSSAGGELLGT